MGLRVWVFFLFEGFGFVSFGFGCRLKGLAWDAGCVRRTETGRECY